MDRRTSIAMPALPSRYRASAGILSLLAVAHFACRDGSPSSCEPRGPEICNGLDDDCNGVVDDVVVIAPEVCNGVDDDCDGEPDEGVEPQPEVCNGVDDDCDGETDEDLTLGDETCNGVDDDCDGIIDEGVYGVVSGPWLVAAETGRMLGVGGPSTVPMPDGRLFITWASRYDDGTGGSARYAVVDPATGESTMGTLAPFPAEGAVAVLNGDRVDVFVVVGPPNWVPRDGPGRLVSLSVQFDGTVSETHELWIDPATSGPWYRVTPVAAALAGDHVVVGLMRDWEDSGAFSDELVVLDIAPDATVAGIWPDPSSRLLDRHAGMTVAADGSFWMMWLEDDGSATIQHGGPASNPFGGPTYGVAGPSPAPGRPVLPTSQRLGIGIYPTFVLAGEDRVVGVYVADFVGDQPLGAPVAELRLVGDTFRPWHATPVQSDPVPAPVLGPGTGANFLIAASGSPGPDRDEEVMFWHARDLRSMANSAPTGTIEWDHGSAPGLLTLSIGSVDGDRTLLLVDDVEVRPTNTYAVLLGCLP